MFFFAKCGLRWGDQQNRSRSSSYFIIVSCIVLPIMTWGIVNETRLNYSLIKNLWLRDEFFSTTYTTLIYLTIAVAFLGSILSYFAAVCENRNLIEVYTRF